MKNLKKYSEEIYTCTKCGLCQAICPIFEVEKKETALSRGLFTLLNGVLTNKIKASKNLTSYLDLCLNCNACKSFCPSDISAEKIITTAKYDLIKKHKLSFLKKNIVNLFSSKFKLKIINLVITTYNSLKLNTLTNLIPNKKLKLFNYAISKNIRYKKFQPKKIPSQKKIVYFPGCINSYINNSVENAVKTVMDLNGFNYIIPKGLSCCGMPARSCGDLDSFIKQAKNNLDKIDCNIDYLITDCATCGSVWQLYEELLEGEYKEKAKILKNKAININQFLIKESFYIPEKIQLNKSVTYHEPCHLRNNNITAEPREIIKLLPGIKFIEMKDASKCCGAAGTFCITQSKISRKISKLKAENIINTKSDIALTSCPSCKIGLTQGLLELNKTQVVLQPIELLAQLYIQEEELI